MPATMLKAQSALEYLTTYGWAIIILGIVLAALFALGVFTPSGFVSTTCVFPGEFSCISAALYSINSTAVLNVQQATISNINVTAIGCNNQATLTNMCGTANNWCGASNSNAITMTIGANYTFYVSCYQNGSLVSINPGQIYRGYIELNYTSLSTNFPHTVSGTLIAKAS